MAMSAPTSLAAATVDDVLNSLLSSSQFTVASYLNVAFSEASSSPDTDDLQRRMAELALQLQLQTQSCHEDIGKIGAELQAILPRCAADVGRVGVGLEGMRMDAQSLMETTTISAGGGPNSTQQQHDLSSSLETLSTLHALQSNLSRTKQVLTAAATWDSTLATIPPLLAQQQTNLPEAVNALGLLEHGERALRGMPHPQERQAQIFKIRNQVQVLLQPQLKHALQNMNTRLAPLQQCVSLYAQLGKMDSLQAEYVKNRPGAIHKAWFAFSPSYNSEGGGEGMEHSTSSMSSSRETFLTWLPGWYDAVLSLLTEERRQSLSVFGPEMAPEILVKVLSECFRPILPSFQSRLESLYSSSLAAPAKGSFESICAIYESTLRFLSVTYELVAGAFLDVAEAGSAKKGDNGIGLYQEMISVFTKVASPFSNYQERFEQLETKHSQVATQLVSKDIQQAVSTTASLEALQDATERLKDLAPFIFPMMEGSLGRFELLNGGYKATQALGTVDQVLSGHAGELTIAIRTLSAAMTADANRLAEHFDEQHVLCAMEVLKIAGSFCRDLRLFEGKTRERLGMLSERMSEHLKYEQELKEALSASGTKKKSSFNLPDSMSVVEIDSVLTKAVCSMGNEDNESNTALTVLQRLAAADERTHVSLYPESEDVVKRLANSCHTFVFDVCSAVPRNHLGGMSEMTCWREVASANDFDSYGTLPQQYITHVGEHMLALVQALEPFASDPEALSLANEVMEGVRDVALQPWGEFAAATGLSSSDSVVAILMNGKEIVDYVLNNAALAEEDAQLEDDVGEDEKKSAEFCNAWLDVVGLSVTGRLLERIMRISQLTPKGCEHLSVDLNYLVNVFSALGVAGHPHPLVTHLAELAVLGDDDLREHIMTRDRNNPVAAALKAVEVRVALLRGIVVN